MGRGGLGKTHLHENLFPDSCCQTQHNTNEHTTTSRAPGCLHFYGTAILLLQQHPLDNTALRGALKPLHCALPLAMAGRPSAFNVSAVPAPLPFTSLHFPSVMCLSVHPELSSSKQ